MAQPRQLLCRESRQVPVSVYRRKDLLAQFGSLIDQMMPRFRQLHYRGPGELAAYDPQIVPPGHRPVPPPLNHQGCLIARCSLLKLPLPGKHGTHPGDRDDPRLQRIVMSNKLQKIPIS